MIVLWMVAWAVQLPRELGELVSHLLHHTLCVHPAFIGSLGTFRSPVPFNVAHRPTLSINRLLLSGFLVKPRISSVDHIKSFVGWNHETELVTPVSQHDGGVQGIANANMMLCISLTSFPKELGWNRTNARTSFKPFARGDTVEWWSAIAVLPYSLNSAPLLCCDSHHFVFLLSRPCATVTHGLPP